MSISLSSAVQEPPAEAVIRTLLLTDLVDSTKLVEKLGDARAYEVATRHDRVSRDLLPRFGGLEIDKTDGFLLLFERPLDAVSYALAYHQALAELSVELGVQLRARAGIHLGEVFLRENDPEDVARGAKPLEVEGLAKPTAARAMSLAGGKQTLLTQAAFDMAREAAVGVETFGGKLRWLAHGPYLFKGVEEPVEIFEVGVEGLAPLAPPADTAKVRRAVAAGDELTLGWRPAPGLPIPRRSGWVLEKRLGVGGFGEVWLARQESTSETRVFKFCYAAEQLRTLKREVTLFRLLRESLGNRREIVRILDWNFDDAPYFIEEEYVGGGDLLEWAAQQGGLDQVPLETRLEIVAQVADALAAAHSVGVLHKDVKPQNVLIAPETKGGLLIKLADFGISEVIDEKALLAKGITVMGLTNIVASDGSSSITGSHLYMAPEVAEGRVASVQADIYALGVLLYQMMAGNFRRALGSGWRRDVRDDLLAADIAACVDRAPERRPASAREVAEKLRNLERRRRELEAEQKAREEAEAARLALERAQQRRKLFAAIAAAAVVVLAVVSVLAVQAVLARRDAERSRRVAEKARGVADSRRGQAEGLISFMLGDLRTKLKPVGRLEILDDVGERALEYFEAVPEAELSDEELLSRSRALYQIGDVRIAQGNLEAALAPLEEALALAKSLVERDPGDGQRLFELGQAHFWVGFVHWKRGQLEAALGQFHEYLAISGRLVEKNPDNLDWQLELAYAHSNIGSVLETRGNLEEALERFQETLRIKELLVAAEAWNPEWQLELGDQHNHVGSVLRQLGDLTGALEHFEEDFSIKSRLVATDPQHAFWRYRLAISHKYIGDIKKSLGDLEGALTELSAGLRLTSQLAVEDASNTRVQHNLATSHLAAGQIFRAQRRHDDALEQSRTAVELLEDLVARDSSITSWMQDLADAYTNLGETLATNGDLTLAEKAARQALDLLEPRIDRDPENHDVALASQALNLLGHIMAMRGRQAEAQSAWARAVATLEPLAEDSSDTQFLDPYATALMRLNRLRQARAVADKLRSFRYGDREFLDLCREKGLFERSG